MTSQIWSPPWYVSQPLWLTEKKSATVATTWTATITPEGERDVPRQRVGDAPEGHEHGVRPGGGRRAGHRFSRYQATVRAMPSRSGIAAVQPNSSSRARRVEACGAAGRSASSVSQRDRAGEPTSRRDELGGLADRRLLAGAEVDRLGTVVPVAGEREPGDAVVDVEELAGRRAVAPEQDLLLAALAGLDHLADQRRDHVRRLEVEVVARAVEVRGQQEDGVRAVLLAVRLRADEDRLLRDAVRRVRLLRVAVPEVVLPERAPA